MKHIKGFDSLRAISIIFVLITHLGLYMFFDPSGFIYQRVWKLISGTTGVQIFFTLSGFLITSILLAERASSGKINFKNFYIRRFLRLLPPLLIFYVIITFLMYSGSIKTTSIGLLFSFFYLFNFVPNIYSTPELGHTWSLALEEQFYIVWPFLLAFIKDKAVLVVILLLLVLCIATLYVYPQLGIYSQYRMERWFIPAVGPVIIGGGVAIFNSVYNRTCQRVLEGKNGFAFVALVLFVYPVYASNEALKFYMYFQSLGVGLFLLWIAYNQQSRFVQLLNNPITSYIGKISYGLYVYQGLFLRTGPGGDLWFQQFPLNILLTIGLAIVSYHVVERPVLRLKSRFR